MTEYPIQIKSLEPMRVASITVNSTSPEQEATNALLSWARAQSLLNKKFRFFGFDSCEPPPNHTYTTWITVGSHVEDSEHVSIQEFTGGLYASAECSNVEEISTLWKKLSHWLETSEYQYGDQQALEEHLDVLADTPQHFRLYLPVKK